MTKSTKELENEILELDIRRQELMDKLTSAILKDMVSQKIKEYENEDESLLDEIKRLTK